MTLNKAIELARNCGLETVEEAVNNVLMHSTQLFRYTHIDKEIKELLTEAKSHDLNEYIGGVQ